MNRDERQYFGAVEAGGTKFVCAVGDAGGTLHAEHRFATTDPQTTLGEMRRFLRDEATRCGPLRGIGVASFGPVFLDPRSLHYGRTGDTPKTGWSDIDMIAALHGEFGCAIGFDTDVNAAAMAEHRWGVGRDVANLAYVTIGTGIGGGLLIDGVPLHGAMHPEMGHVHPRRHALDSGFPGVCAFHGDCLEGLASGAAIVARTGQPLDRLAADHDLWEIEADYLGQLCAQLVTFVSPQRIVLGGGVMTSGILLPRIRARMQDWLGGYVGRGRSPGQDEKFIVAPALGDRAGVLGALLLGIEAEQQAFRGEVSVAL
jgi:fructokinase